MVLDCQYRLFFMSESLKRVVVEVHVCGFKEIKSFYVHAETMVLGGYFDLFGVQVNDRDGCNRDGRI